MQHAIADEDEAVHGNRDDHRDRQDLVVSAAVDGVARREPSSHHQSDTDRDARQNKGRCPRPARKDPEQMGSDAR